MIKRRLNIARLAMISFDYVWKEERVSLSTKRYDFTQLLCTNFIVLTNGDETKVTGIELGDIIESK